MRILFFHPDAYLPEFAAGCERTVDALCGHFQRAGVECAVLARYSKRGALSGFRRTISKLWRGFELIPDGVLGYQVYRTWALEQTFPVLLKYYRPSVVVMTKYYWGSIVNLAISHGVPIVYYFQDVEFVGITSPITQLPGVGFLANSRYTAARVANLCGLSPTIAFPLVEAAQYRTAGRGTKAVFINPVPEKGVEVALYIAKQRPDVEFLFVECWPVQSDAKRAFLAQVAGLRNVVVQSVVDDMRLVYEQARVVLAPSQWDEAWCRVVTEAQVSGIPVLASACGGLPESVGPGGLLVVRDAPGPDWLDAFNRLWDDPECYHKLSTEALAHAQREEIAPKHIAMTFLEALKAHAAAGVMSP